MRRISAPRVSRYLIFSVSVSLHSLHSASTYSTWYIPNLFPAVSSGIATFLCLPTIIYDGRKPQPVTYLFIGLEIKAVEIMLMKYLQSLQYKTCLHFSHVTTKTIDQQEYTALIYWLLTAESRITISTWSIRYRCCRRKTMGYPLRMPLCQNTTPKGVLGPSRYDNSRNVLRRWLQ